MKSINSKSKILNVVKYSFFLLLISLFFTPQTTIAQSSDKITMLKWDNDGQKLSIKRKSGKYKFEFEGEITLSDDDKDIVAISNNGFMKISKSSFGKKRRLIIESEGGTLIKKYYLGNKEVNFNPEGKKWLAEILPGLINTTTIGAKSRVERFYKNGGAQNVLTEVENIDSDYVKSAYIKILLKKDLNDNELVQITNTIGTDISSDYHKSNMAKQLLKNSDYSNSQTKAVLNLSQKISSDYHKAQLFYQVLKNSELNSTNLDLLLEKIKRISSDYHKAEVLKNVIKKTNLSSSHYSKFLETTSKISSDYHASEVLVLLINKKENLSNISEILTLVEQRISSDSHSAKIYNSLYKHNSLDENAIIQILLSASNDISSDYYLSEILTTYSKFVKKGSEKLKKAYTEAAKAISSETQYGRVMKAIF